ncbi:phage head-tail connector protein [Bacillus sonorensis]|uniref:phage head-tail connector protein n=1 Tax=Bacillus sonorensis TaxID=119858 RepID=UPI00228063A2|nr:phage head-tail connector protein [Bacillus sonorensis]MCY8035636.1 phage head-tail connector protein [Bacillus sonorensis]MCY8563697.1 phage head-tail connector protein [Bacillus sonorensis]MEC1428866.1 phage head-tail connector protein [Bacillus sonorensis]
MDIQTVKRLLQIKTDKYDEYLKEAVPFYIDIAKDYCNNSFTKDSEEVLPSGVKLFVAKACEFSMNPVNLSSRSLGDASYSFVTELPKTVWEYLGPHKKLRFP